MTDNPEGVIQSISLNQVLISILEEHGKLTVPTSRFLQSSITDKELVVEYDENIPSFTFSLRNKDEQPGNS